MSVFAIQTALESMEQRSQMPCLQHAQKHEKPMVNCPPAVTQNKSTHAVDQAPKCKDSKHIFLHGHTPCINVSLIGLHQI